MHVMQPFLTFRSGVKARTKKTQETTTVSSGPASRSSDESEDEVKSIIADDYDGPKRKRRLSEVLDSTSNKRHRGRKSEAQGEEFETTARSSSRRKRSMPEINSATKARNTTSSRRKSTTRRSPSTSRAPVSRSREQEPDDDSTPDEILLLPPKTKNSSVDAAAEQTIDLDLQYPSSASSPGGSGHADQGASGPSVFGAPILLTNQAEQPSPVAPSAGPSPSVPAHRARRPKVKLYEDPLLSAGDASGSAISTKAKVMRQNGQSTLQADVSPSTGPVRTRGRVSGSKAGPGRSSSGLITGSTSLFTTVRGKLQSVKGQVFSGRHARVEPHAPDNGGGEEPSAMADPTDPEVVEPPLPPPTGEELLRQAGYNAVDAQNLSDFEDDIDAHGEPDPDHPQPQGTVFNGQQTVTVAQETVHSQSSGANRDSAAVEQSITMEQDIAQPITETGESSDAPPVAEAVAERPFPAAWRMSTIFGPLGLGRETTLTQKEEPAEENTEVSTSGDSTGHLSLSLDYSISVPVHLKDICPPVSLLESLGAQPIAGPPGKFYKNEHAPTVLQTFRLEDSTARLILDPAADESHRQHFARFCSRLHAGELFVEMIGVKLLAMYSSENRALGERLGAPSNLLGLSDSVLVAQVAIENQSGYVDAVAYADETQWSASA